MSQTIHLSHEDSPAVRDGASVPLGDGVRASLVEETAVSPPVSPRDARTSYPKDAKRSEPLALPLIPGYACCLRCTWSDYGSDNAAMREHTRSTAHPTVYQPLPLLTPDATTSQGCRRPCPG